MNTTEYSVCEDCCMELAYADGNTDIDQHIKRELAGREGHFCLGIEPTEDDPYGTGYEEFSGHECELCRSGLGGSRHGVTLVITDTPS